MKGVAYWATNGGTIDSSGEFTAGSNYGIFNVTVKDNLSGMSSKAIVSVQETVTSVKEQSPVNNIANDVISLLQN